MNNYIEQINHAISKSWDENVFVRAADLEENTDYTYINIIKPWVIRKTLCLTKMNDSIIDIGCGCGYLTNTIYQNGRKNIIGIDISPISIEYAKNKYPHITFYCNDFCNFVSKRRVNMCWAVMMMNYVPDIHKFFASVRRSLLPNGKFAAIIPHPQYWPQKHIKNNNYSYENEDAYIYNFATKGRADYDARVLYCHRKLETYIFCAYKNGFMLTDLQGLDYEQNNKYPDILYMEFILADRSDNVFLYAK